MNYLFLNNVQSKLAHDFTCFVTLLLIPFVLTSPVRQHEHQKHSLAFNENQQVQLSIASERDDANLHRLNMPRTNEKIDDDVITDVIEIDSCPEPPKIVPEELCTEDPCTNNEDCDSINKTCCFNGCLFTCLSSTQPPALIDWQTLSAEKNSDILLEDVDYEFKSGEDLIESNNRLTYVGELCTTTVDEDGMPPLACPHGYICHVENPGDLERGIPDSGRCMHFDTDIDDVFNDLNFE